MNKPPAIASYLSVALVALSTGPALWRLAIRSKRVKTINDGGLYEDEDGIATEESMEKFSAKRQFPVLSALMGLGLAISFALAIFATVRKQDASFSDTCILELWLLFAAWIFTSIQVLDTSLEKAILPRFRLVIWTLLPCALLDVLAWAVLVGDMPDHPESVVLVVITAVQALAATAALIVLFSIERRPDVYRPDGQVVERQYQSSLWHRYALSWSAEILDLAAEKTIETTDLPAPDGGLRAENSRAWFTDMPFKPTVTLWKLILWKIKWRLAWQWLLIVISTFFDVGPQFAMLHLLRLLEARNATGSIDPQAWLWVLALFLITVGSTLIDYRISWQGLAEIALPVRSILTTLIFEKMVRLKDIKEPPKSESESSDKSKPDDTVDSTPAANDEGPVPKTNQDIVNMFAVDTNLVAVFATSNQMYINFVMRVILAVVFLWFLVGWESMLAGMCSMLFTYPINHYLGKRYNGYQKALMKARDKKTTVISEALQGIRQIKFSAIEAQWTAKIDEVREEELTKIWQTKINSVIMGLASDLTPVLFATFALATYTYLNGNLLPSIAFVALSLFIELEGLSHMLPYLFVMGVNAKVSCDRIHKFLQAPEMVENTYPGESVSFHNAVVAFPSETVSEDDRFILRDLNLDFPKNALSIISGPTGSGKSLLLSAILGEADVLSGDIRVPRPLPIEKRYDSKATADNWILPTAIAFVSQTPWIENATIKANILFGLPDDPIRYEKVVKACALSKDLAMFEDGDQTEVGAQGISLSGGQKWRLTLARAFYSRAGILILDDVFSALDAHVGKEIYENALMGELSQGRTRILVTHHVSLCLPGAEYAVRLSARGALEHAGLTQDLKETGEFAEILDASEHEAAEAVDEQSISTGTTIQDPANGSVEVVEDVPAVPKATPKKLVEDESRETGAVKRSVYLKYFKATGGFPFWTFVLTVYFVGEVLSVGRSWWVKVWTSSYEHSEGTSILMSGISATSTHRSLSHLYAMHGQTMNSLWTGVWASRSNDLLSTAFTSSNETFYKGLYSLQTEFLGSSNQYTYPANPSIKASDPLAYYLGLYIVISLGAVFVAAAEVYFVYRGSLSASRSTFRDMLRSVLRTPLRWLDTVPTGRILNRFTADFTNMDSQLSMNFAYVIGGILEMIGIFASAIFISPYMILLSVILLAICGQMGIRYLRGARSIKRLESIQKSPMISLFSSSLDGLSTIRAYSNTPVFVKRMYKLIDAFAIATWHNRLFNAWVGLRMAMVGSVFSSAVAAFIVATRGVDASLAGFALAFALGYRHAAIRIVRLLADTELDMNAAERIFEYSELESEKQDGIDNLRASWPEEGRLEVKDLEVGYAKDLPAILKGLTFKADMNQRIGVVGRTGAGKSTLSLALFRFLEARRGSITIDGIDISTVRLHDLRTRLAIIPQDPVLFSGTIRTNLDPFNEFSDFQIREALARVHLIPSSSSTPAPEIIEGNVSSSSSVTAVPKANANPFLSLSSPISSSGSNLSQGQKQLLCLARAILSRPRLLLLDEATSAVDMVTDALIQRSIREEFANTTLLVVAHRLSTVVDFDRILVMSDGVAAEFGSPSELFEKEGGVWKSMVERSGEKDELVKALGGK